MNYMNITHCDMLNGDGLRTVLWVSGCNHNCKNCQNPFSHNCQIGVLFDEAAKNELFKDLESDWCSGVTFSGGDPLHENNRETIIELSKEIKEKYPSKNIWLYTGYTWNEIVDSSSMQPILKYVDVVVDGPYIEELRDIKLKWRGSSNQNVIAVKRRIEQVLSIQR